MGSPAGAAPGDAVGVDRLAGAGYLFLGSAPRMINNDQTLRMPEPGGPAADPLPKAIGEMKSIFRGGTTSRAGG